MPSPFPGMDPYLENPVWWPNFHHLLISSTNSILKEQLHPRGYIVAIEERVWLVEPERLIRPDLAVIEQPRPKAVAVAATAVMEADEPVHVSFLADEIHESFLEIYDSQGHRLVTGIEFLSPTNKVAGRGRDLYLQKQMQLRNAGVSNVEIDLLHCGTHTVAVPIEAIAHLAPWDYLVCVDRAGVHGELEVYPITLRVRLPRIRIPLKSGEPDAVLDLQAVCTRAYDEGPFADRIDYNAPPSRPLADADAAWAATLMRQAGLHK